MTAQSASSVEKAQVFAEVKGHIIDLSTHVFGNYVVQKLLEHGDKPQINGIVSVLRVRGSGRGGTQTDCAVHIVAQCCVLPS